MARDAVVRSRMLVECNLCGKIRGMALQTYGCVVRNRFRTFVKVMWVVACLACQCTFALQIALRLSQPVWRVHDLEVVGASVCGVPDKVGVETGERLIGGAGGIRHIAERDQAVESERKNDEPAEQDAEFLQC